MQAWRGQGRPAAQTRCASNSTRAVAHLTIIDVERQPVHGCAHASRRAEEFGELLRADRDVLRRCGWPPGRRRRRRRPRAVRGGVYVRGLRPQELWRQPCTVSATWLRAYFFANQAARSTAGLGTNSACVDVRVGLYAPRCGEKGCSGEGRTSRARAQPRRARPAVRTPHATHDGRAERLRAGGAVDEKCDRAVQHRVHKQHADHARRREVRRRDGAEERVARDAQARGLP